MLCTIGSLRVNQISIPDLKFESNISGYDLFRNRLANGSVIFTHVKLKATPLESFFFFPPDSAEVKVETTAGLLNVACVHNLDSLQIDDNSELIVIGDMNLADVNWTSGRDIADLRLLDGVNYTR